MKRVSAPIWVMRGILAAFLAIITVIAFQNCGEGAGLQGDPNRGEKSRENGQGYGGMRTLKTVVASAYEPKGSDELDEDVRYYRLIPGFRCEIGAGPVDSYAGLIFLRDQEIRLFNNQCSDDSSVISDIEVASYNRSYLGFESGIFERRETPPDVGSERLRNFLWCRTKDSTVVGTDIILKRKVSDPHTRGDESVSLDLSRGPLDPRIQYSRADSASIATYFDASGVLRKAAPGMPRFDHDPILKQPLGLLIEEGRTNYILASESLDQAAWSVSGPGLSIQADQAKAPDSTMSAERLIISPSSSAVVTQDVSGVSVVGKRFSFTVWAKATQKSARLRLGFYDSVLGYQWSTEVFEIDSTWRRLVFTGNFGGAQQAKVVIGGPGEPFSADLLVWGAQLEQGNIPTSYIATANAPVSRSPDLVKMTDLSWLTQGQGTVLADFNIPYLDGDSMMSIMGLRAADKDRIIFYRSPNNSNYFWASVIDQGAIQYSRTDVNVRLLPGVPSRAILAYKDGVFRSAVNGFTHQSSRGTVPKDITELYLGQWIGNQFFLNGHLKSFKYWSGVKTEIESIELTYPAGEYVAQVILGERTADLGTPYQKTGTAPFTIIKTDRSGRFELRAEEYDFQLDLESRAPGESKVEAVLKATIDGRIVSTPVSCRIEE